VLADPLVGSGARVAETVRRLAAAVVTFVGQGLIGQGLNDDATMLLVEYRGNTDQPD
jgi:hypothetical protein